MHAPCILAGTAREGFQGSEQGTQPSRYVPWVDGGGPDRARHLGKVRMASKRVERVKGGIRGGRDGSDGATDNVLSPVKSLYYPTLSAIVA